MKIYFLTLFKDMMLSALNSSILKRAIDNNIIEVEVIDIRDFACNKHNRVDDYPYGGGAGMVMQAEPIMKAYESIKDKLPEKNRFIFTSPKGKTLSPAIAKDLAKEEAIVILCGHYEGVDQRLLDELKPEHLSIGDYILTGGELPGLVITDVLARFIPGVLGNEDSAYDESFDDNLLEYPQYTRPEVWRDKKVPEVLLSGHHGNIEKWRLEKAREDTLKYRKDLIEKSNWTNRSRLIIGDKNAEKLKNSHVAVFGLGGVGGAAAEALVRSGVGKLTVIDKDVVDITNFNRQLLADASTLGRLKTDVAKERFLSINSQLDINSYDIFYGPDNQGEIDFSQFDYVIDAVDTVTAKLFLINNCKENNVPVISCMGTGFRSRVDMLKVDDIYNTCNDPLAKVMRKELKKMGIESCKVVFSTELPKSYHKDYANTGSEKREKGKSPIGSMMFVPSSAGMMLASAVVDDLLK